MKVKLIANELVDGEINFVSLVKNGANRIPFRIVKSEDPVEGDGGMFRLGDLVRADFSKQFSSYVGSTSFAENASAQAFFPSMHQAMEALAESTFNSLDRSVNMKEAGDLIDKNLMEFRKHVMKLVKQLPDSVIKSEKGALRKQFEGDTLQSSANTPSATGSPDMPKINEAAAGDLEGLNDTADADAAKLAKAEAAAFAAIEKQNADADAAAAADTTSAVDPTPAKPAAPATDTKVEKRSPGDPAVLSTSDTGEVDRDEGLPAGYRMTQKTMKKMEDGEIKEVTAQYAVNDETGDEIFMGYVQKTDAEDTPDPAAASDAPRVVTEDTNMARMMEGLNLVAKTVNTLVETVKEQGERIEAVAKTADEAVEKADNTTVVSVAHDLDQSLATLSSHDPITKTDAPKSSDIFRGLCPELDALEDAFGNRS